MTRQVVLALALAISGCDSGSVPRPPPDAGPDAGVDAGADAGADAGEDAGTDGGRDAGVDAGADAGVDAGADAGVDAGADAGVDAGADAGVDAGADAGPDAGGQAFIEEFLDGGNLDTRQTTASLDTSGTGRAYVAPLLAFESTGDGGDGQWVVDGGDPSAPTLLTLPAGTWQFSAVELGAVRVVSDGGVTLLVQGPVTLDRHTVFNVPGALRIVSGGRMVLGCAELDATGDVAIHQTSDAGLYFSCASAITEVFTLPRAAGEGSSGSIEVWTRGELRMDDEVYLETGPVTDPDAGSGKVTLRAYGDLLIGNSLDPSVHGAGNSYIITGRHLANGSSGDIDLAAEGSFVLDDNSYLIGGSGHLAQPGTNITARFGGDTLLRNNSYFIAGSSGDVLLVSQGDVWLDQHSYILNGQDGARRSQFAFQARSMRLTGSSYVLGGNTIAGGATDISIELAGDLAMDGGSAIYAGPGRSDPSGCPDGGAGVVSVRAGGSVLLADDWTEIAGGSGQGCAAGGEVVVQANGSIDADYPGDGGPRIYGGDGLDAGVRTLLPDAGLAPFAPDAGLRVESVAVSAPLQGQGTVDACLATGQQGVAAVSFALDGVTFTPANSCVGKSLQPGWRYQASLVQRLFDGASVDRLEVDWH